MLVSGSCEEQTSYQMHLWIKNETGNTLTLKVFPKNEYDHNGLYVSGDFGSGYRSTEIEIELNKERGIFFQVI